MRLWFSIESDKMCLASYYFIIKNLTVTIIKNIILTFFARNDARYFTNMFGACEQNLIDVLVCVPYCVSTGHAISILSGLRYEAVLSPIFAQR